jgi:multidrug resistance protein MdtO
MAVFPAHFYLMEVPLIQFRVYSDRDRQSRPFAQIEKIFRDECARAFQNIAASLEEQLNQRPYSTGTPRSLRALLEDSRPGQDTTSPEREQVLFRMALTIASLVDRLQNEVASEPLYATE